MREGYAITRFLHRTIKEIAIDICPKVSKHRNYERTDSFGHFAFDNGWVLIPGSMLYNKETAQHNTLL